MTSVKRLLMRVLISVWIKDEECYVVKSWQTSTQTKTSGRNFEFDCFQQSDSLSTIKSGTHHEYESTSSKSKPYSIF